MEIPIIDMISRAGWVARTILVVLGIFSVVTWAIIFNRYLFLRKAEKLSKDFLKQYNNISLLIELDKIQKKLLNSPMGRLAQKCLLEYHRIIDDSSSHTGIKDWSFFIQNQFTIASEKLESYASEISLLFDRGLILLAISSSACPFIGLLGTVWGIMDSFYEIGNQGSASLPVVAPGIAEALVVTLVGLAVAIPAVIFYNYFVHKADRLESQLNDYKNVLYAHLKRDILSAFYRNGKS